MNNKNLNHTISQLLNEQWAQLAAPTLKAGAKRVGPWVGRALGFEAQGAAQAGAREMVQGAAQVGGRGMAQGAAQAGAREMAQGAAQAQMSRMQNPSGRSAPWDVPSEQQPQENPMGQLFGGRQQQSPGSMQGMFGGGAQAPQRMPQQEPQRMPFAEPPLPDEMQTMQPMEMPRGPSPQTMTSPMGGPSPQTVGAMDQINALGGEASAAEPNMFAQYAAFITQQNKAGSMMSPAQTPANVPAPVNVPQQQGQPLAASGGGTTIPTDTVPPPQIAPRQMQSPRGVPPAPTEAPQGYANQMGGDLTSGNWGQFDPEGPGEFSQSQNQYQDQLSPEEEESQRRQRYFRKSMQQPRQQQVYTSEATMVDIDDIDIEQLMRKKKMPDIVPAELLIRKFQSHEADDPTKPSKSSFRPLDQQVERHRAVSDRFRSNPFFTIPAQSSIALNFPNVTRGRRPYIAD